MRKFFKIVWVVVGSLMILFGIIGGIIELSSEKADLSGLILAPLFIALGIGLAYLGIRKKRPGLSKPKTGDNPPENQKPVIKQQTNPEPVPEPIPVSITEKKTVEPSVQQQTGPGHVPWQRTFLIIAGWTETIFLILTIIFALIFGIAGFAGGEMGNMVGLLMFGAVIGIGGIISVRVVALWGIIKKKRWAPALNLGLMILLIFISLFSLAWPMMIYWGFEAWCSYFVVQHPMPAVAGTS